MDDKLLEIKNLSVIYKTDEAIVHAVNRINFEIGTKETIGLVGETGAGKTTTALAVMQLLPERTGSISEGEIFFKGENLLKKSKNEMRLTRGARMSMIFQDPMTSLNPIVTVGEQIRESLEIHNHDKKNKKELEARVDELLTLVGIQPRRKGEFPHQFSGGMKQRVVIAIALACNPELLIADEPTTALDVTIQAQVLALMAELKEKLNTSMIMITHDLGVVAETCDKVAIMYAGEIVEKGTVQDIFEGKQHHPYTLGLFGSIPDLEIETPRLSPIDGLMPDPTNLPDGCKFHPRCKSCRKICTQKQPEPHFFGAHMIACHLYAKEV
ncbi:ABC transporter ATP-binding protein [Candidatus Formimonas warabiya]|uniref:Dipeptide/oligopeptide/nickel ABC transporter ATP-binding protein n=1 Tax=Formimonas warabiya TaxID=1761012 RepID=A0A3G1KTW4_FORW1|nr:ABC transporter ATP-binding protein [Candidatus Formimonas warabiya]ATW25605.1 dipeptide/oligopeptide/nickel ABC transporter ATP-binding protein [Candidatus Formimonas warabiya]